MIYISPTCNDTIFLRVIIFFINVIMFSEVLLSLPLDRDIFSHNYSHVVKSTLSLKRFSLRR